MAETIKIVSLELENVKRVRAVALSPAATGLTVIGGDNRQGKTSILDGICYALGGERYRPTNLQREDGQATARIEVTLSNGLKVERKGKNAALTVTDTTGTRQGQRLLDTFIEELALDLPKFLRASGKEKALTLLRILGIEDQLAALDREEKAAYDERTAQGRIADQKAKYAAEMPEHHDAPEALVSASELMAEVQAVAARNAERTAARNAIAEKRTARDRTAGQVDDLRSKVKRLANELVEAEQDLAKREADLAHLQGVVAAAESGTIPTDESTANIEARMAELEVTNAKVRANLDKRKAQEDAKAAAEEVAALTAKVEDVRARRMALLAGADMPLPGLNVFDGELVLSGKAWDCMSSAEQVRAGVAIVRCLKPECGFVLLDGMETFDGAQLAEFGAWLVAEGLQGIATRVSKGGECSIIIEDGLVVDPYTDDDGTYHGASRRGLPVIVDDPDLDEAPPAVATATEQDW